MAAQPAASPSPACAAPRAMPPGTVLHLVQDRQVFADGEPAELFFRVVSGVVRCCKFLSDGHRQIAAFHVAGDVFGLEAGGGYTLSAETVTDCTLVAYQRRTMDALARKDPTFARELFSHAMRGFAQARRHALLLGRRSAAGKVAAFLGAWAAQAGQGDMVTLPMTRQDIADYLGLTIETVSRTLTQMERDGAIDIPNTRQIRLRNRQAADSPAA